MRPDPNAELIDMVAQALGRLNDRVVYMGGCAVGLLITDAARSRPRPTLDVDVIVELASRTEYHALARELHEAGFREDQDSEVICRWKTGALRVDVIPTDASILGFTNRWLRRAVKDASPVTLPSGIEIRLISPPMLLATKIEAFYDRGRNDFLVSHDLEDIVTILDGRAELIDEVRATDMEVRRYLQEEFDYLLAETDFAASIPGHLGPSAEDQQRVGLVIERARRLSGN